MLVSALLLASLSVVPARSSSCDCQLLPELSFALTGQNLDWPCESTHNIYESTGRYIPRNIIVTRVQTHKDEAIVAIPRYKSGVPITLGITSLKNKNCKPSITPFPSWEIQEEGNCVALQSAVDIVLDVQDILWVLDVGIVNTLEQPVRRCQPKILAIDIKSGKVRSYFYKKYFYD